MTREIKFRAWDKEMAQMIYQGSNTTETNGVMGSVFLFNDMGCSLDIKVYGEEIWHPVHNFELMQFTGLRDTHGVEVYEGDLLSYSGQENLIAPSVVEWSEHLARWVGVCGNKRKIPLEHCKDSRVVVGNIYEHPSILSEV